MLGAISDILSNREQEKIKGKLIQKGDFFFFSWIDGGLVIIKDNM